MRLSNAKPTASPSLPSHGNGLQVLVISLRLPFHRLFVFFVGSGGSPGDYKDFKPNNPDIKVEDGTLMITNIQKNNEGYYLCEAVNGIGSGLSAVVQISVQGTLA